MLRHAAFSLAVGSVGAATVAALDALARWCMGI